MNFRLCLALLLGFSVACAPSFYAKKYKSLPPGLQKKMERGKPLPPGLQKKLATGEVLDQGVYARSRQLGSVNNKGIVTIQVDDRVIRLHKATREIVDILK